MSVPKAPITAPAQPVAPITAPAQPVAPITAPTAQPKAPITDFKSVTVIRNYLGIAKKYNYNLNLPDDCLILGLGDAYDKFHEMMYSEWRKPEPYAVTINGRSIISNSLTILELIKRLTPENINNVVAYVKLTEKFDACKIIMVSSLISFDTTQHEEILDLISAVNKNEKLNVLIKLIKEHVHKRSFNCHRFSNEDTLMIYSNMIRYITMPGCNITKLLEVYYCLMNGCFKIDSIELTKIMNSPACRSALFDELKIVNENICYNKIKYLRTLESLYNTTNNKYDLDVLRKNPHLYLPKPILDAYNERDHSRNIVNDAINTLATATVQPKAPTQITIQSLMNMQPEAPTSTAQPTAPTTVQHETPAQPKAPVTAQPIAQVRLIPTVQPINYVGPPAPIQWLASTIQSLDDRGNGGITVLEIPTVDPVKTPTKIIIKNTGTAISSDSEVEPKNNRDITTDSDSDDRVIIKKNKNKRQTDEIRHEIGNNYYVKRKLNNLESSLTGSELLVSPLSGRLSLANADFAKEIEQFNANFLRLLINYQSNIPENRRISTDKIEKIKKFIKDNDNKKHLFIFFNNVELSEENYTCNHFKTFVQEVFRVFPANIQSENLMMIKFKEYDYNIHAFDGKFHFYNKNKILKIFNICVNSLRCYYPGKNIIFEKLSDDFLIF
jgi:hypothetical protein